MYLSQHIQWHSNSEMCSWSKEYTTGTQGRKCSLCNINMCWGFPPSQLTAFAYRDYLSFGYVYVGLRGTEELSSQYNINVYTPTMMIFKEHIDRPADVVQVSLRALSKSFRKTGTQLF